MTAVRRAGGVRRRLAAAFVVVCCGLALGGCAAIDGMLETEDALVDAGFDAAEVSFESNNGIDSVYVTWESSAETSEGLRAESLGVAEVVWRVAPLKMDLVETDPEVRFAIDSVQVGTVFPRGQLEAEFGPRPPGLDKEFTELLNLREIAIGVVVAVLVFVAIVVLVIVLVVRSARKKRAARPAGPWPAPYAPQPWPQQGAWPQQQQQPPYVPPPQGGWPPQPPPPTPGNDPWGAPPR